MITVILGLSSALVYGAADFFGGIASTRIPAVKVVAGSGLIGLLVLIPASALTGGTWSNEVLLWGVLSGMAGSMGILTLYMALAIGPMSILSPLTAVMSAIVPLSWGLINGERLSLIGYAALGIALVAVVLVGFVPEKGAVRPRLRGVLLAVLSGTLIGTLLILLDAAPDDAGLLPLTVNRMTHAVILWTIVGVMALASRSRQPSERPAWRRVIPLIVAAGLADSTANILMVTGFRLGDLSVVAVLTALYPAGTIALAAIVLRERIAPVQWVGLVLALTAAALLALR
ncbi:MAG TPA: DMT family transporter [Pseudolysinimonas sp.]|nr:DMT family transporter [Pseudolysinimonas sp.]